MDPLKSRFIKLWQESGWPQAEAARRLSLTRGGINGIITGPAIPSQSLVSLFELVLEAHRAGRPVPDAVQPPSVQSEDPPGKRRVPGWAEPLFADLEHLEESARAQAISICQGVVATFPKRKVSYAPSPPAAKPKPRRISSEGMESTAQVLRDLAVKEVAEKNQLRPLAGSSAPAPANAPKSPPAGESHRSSSPPSRPAKPAPVAREIRGGAVEHRKAA